jgi:hypothetical protein
MLFNSYYKCRGDKKLPRKCQKASANHQSMRMNVVAKKKNVETRKSLESLLDTGEIQDTIA